MNLKNVPFSYHWILRRAMGEDITTILDMGCGDGFLMTDLSKGEEWETTGIDIFPNSVEKAKARGVYAKLCVGSVVDLPDDVLDRKYDLVFSSQVLEHLDKKDGKKAVKIWESVSKRGVVVTTTNGYIDYEPIENKADDKNPYQKHRSGWISSEFKKRGYSVRGQGLKLIYGKGGVARKTPQVMLPFWRIVAYLFSPLVYLFPKYGLIIVCRKDFVVQDLRFSGERAGSLDGINLARYAFAIRHLKGKTILELGGGSGAGAAYFSSNGAKYVVSVDKNRKAVEHAKRVFRRGNLKYKVQDIVNLNLKRRYEGIVAMEVIEHLGDYRKMLRVVVKHLRSKGVLIVSTPNKFQSAQDGDKPSNPFHEREFTPAEFENVLKEFFSSVELFGIFTKGEKAVQEKLVQDGLRWRLSSLLVRKRQVRRLVNYLPSTFKKSISGEKNLNFEKQDFEFMKANINNAPYMIAVCRK